MAEETSTRCRPPQGAGPRHLADRKAARQGLHHADGCRLAASPGGRHPHRRDQPRRRHRNRRRAPRPYHRALRPGVGWQDDALAAPGRRRPDARRRGRLRRRRARARHRVRREVGGQHREPAVSQPDTGEQALEIVEILVRSGAVDLIVIDSVAALVPKAEIEGEMGDTHMGLQARLMCQALRKLAGDQKLEMRGDLHQSAARKDRGHVRQPGDHHRRPRAQVLRVVRLDIRRIGPVKEGER